MATKKTTKKAATKMAATKKAATKKTAPAKKATSPKAAKPAATKPAARGGQLSAIDAAAQVLQKAKSPMRTKQMITAMAAQGLWSSPAGKTPHATLYSAILREITTKGAQARFKKVERGQFEYNG
ncbi:MAG TPA: HTH domain-containing protein [Phycisphaerae bacterium]|nr:HTH domain-containing protein [Phycisphaerae bacterium]